MYTQPLNFKLLLALGLFLSSCCTQKKCDQEIFPIIHCRFADAQPGEMFDMELLRLVKGTNIIVDQFVQKGASRETDLDLFHLDPTKEASDFDYVISSVRNGSDTLRNIVYGKRIEKVPCNTCFPAGDGSATIMTVENMVFIHWGQLYLLGDTLVLSQ